MRNLIRIPNGIAAIVALPIGLVIVAWVAGCQSTGSSTGPSQYISPRVQGRVLDAQSRQPIHGASVRRIVPASEVAPGDVPKGGQAMEQAPEAYTRKDGTFALDSERDLELFRRSGWYSVTIGFRHSGYALFTTNYTLANSTNSPSGEPVVKTGDILLVPLSR